MSTLFDVEPIMHREARFTKGGDQRFLLTRRWVADESTPYVLFVMLNPSTANDAVDDPTIRRCVGFARSWGHGALHVVNLFNLITPSPKVLLPWAAAKEERERSFTHPPNDLEIIRGESERAALTVCGWGAFGNLFPHRARQVHAVLTAPHALRITKDGHPGHPLYLPVHLKPIPFQIQPKKP
jgi:hypothetical protein